MSRFDWATVRLSVGAGAVALVVAASLGAQAPQPAPAGDVVGVGNFAHIVADLDKSLGFYRDVLGLAVSNTIPFGPNEAVAKFGHTEGGQSRVAVLKVPGLAMGVELIEYKEIERKPQHPRFVDPGAANLALRVRDLDSLFPNIQKYPGVTVLSAAGKPVTLTTPNGVLHAVFVQDPDGFVVEMLDVATPPADAPPEGGAGRPFGRGPGPVSGAGCRGGPPPPPPRRRKTSSPAALLKPRFVTGRRRPISIATCLASTCSSAQRSTTPGRGRQPP